MSSIIARDMFSFLNYQYGDAPKLCDIVRAMRVKLNLRRYGFKVTSFLRDDGSILLVLNIDCDTIEISCTTKKTFEIYRESDASEFVYSDENELLNSIPTLRNY